MEESRTPNTEIEFILQEYRKCTEFVKVSMDWEDYFKLIDIAAETNANNAMDLAWRLGYLAGTARFEKE